MAESLIHLRGLRKRFGTRTALADIDLDVAEPQILGVVGPDGAGKTTLLRSLVGLLEIEADEAIVLGHDLRSPDVTALKAELGYVPQSFSLHRDLSVMENLRFTARLHRLPEDTFRRRADELLRRTALAAFTDRAAGALSGGMRQKLAVANALLPEPRMLVLDEPTAGVDVTARRELGTILREAAATALVVASTSYLDEAEAADGLVYLDEGRIVASGPPRELERTTPRTVYRLWGEDVRGIARAARNLPWVADARAMGRFARVEVRNADAAANDAEAGLRRLPAVHFTERADTDMESVLRHFSRS